MTATERLRQLLDERGEHYKTSGNKTWWGRPIDSRTGEPINVYHNQAQPMGEDRLFVELQLATPEQAVEATLGRGTCKVVSKPCDMWECECGKAWWHGGAPNFCPSCGREVVVS